MGKVHKPTYKKSLKNVNLKLVIPRNFSKNKKSNTKSLILNLRKFNQNTSYNNFNMELIQDVFNMLELVFL